MGRVHGYPSDLTDTEWAVVEPLLPPVSKDGRNEAHPRREIVDAIFYIAHSGCSWRSLPKDFPPWETVYGFVTRWHDHGVTAKIHDALRDKLRALEGREPEPTAAVIDSQLVKGAPTVGKDSRGYDAGKKVNGRKRFIITDTLGLLLCVLVVPARGRPDRARRVPAGPRGGRPGHPGDAVHLAVTDALPARLAMRACRTGTPLPGVGDEPYADDRWAVGRRGDAATMSRCCNCTPRRAPPTRETSIGSSRPRSTASPLPSWRIVARRGQAAITARRALWSETLRPW